MRVPSREKGSVTMLALVFGSIFLMLLSGLLGFVALQHRQSVQRVGWNESLAIAEAGAQYARWRLAHSPEDYGFSGQYDFKDPEGDAVGKYQLEIIAPSGCDSSVRISSTGWTLRFPNTQRTVRAQYAKPSLARYAFLANSNVWFGQDEELQGPFHSNGGIRMDGIQNALATSAKETYTCVEEHGCSPSEEKPGIWGQGTGGQDGLWQFPVSNVDFDGITQDLSVLRDEAQASGIYLGQLGLGYHVKFRNNGTIDVYRVKSLKQKVWGWDMVQWKNESNDIDSEEFYQNYSLPANCAPIFVADNVWVDGDVAGKATLVAAKIPEVSGNSPKIVINGNITYSQSDSVLGLIGQQDILIPLYAPSQLQVQASLLAQKGHVLRYYYPNWNQEPYRTYAIRDSIETYGSLITSTAWTFTWVDEDGAVVSGYGQTEMNYDAHAAKNPPPYFPVSGEYEIFSWEEL
jgi:hypothetical protein